MEQEDVRPDDRPAPTPAAETPSNGEPQSPTVSAAGVAELEKQVAELKDRVLRALAETENVRRRADKEREDASKYAVTSFAREVVSVADNLRRALESSSKPGDSDAAKLKGLVEGVELTERSLHAMLERFGIKVINPLGHKFDPNLHQALYEVPDASKDAGTIVQVIQQGYQIADRLLRPALVAVAKGGTPAQPQANIKA